MNLEQLRAELHALDVKLTLTPAGGLRYDAPSPIPARLVEGMKTHKKTLTFEVEKGCFYPPRFNPKTESSLPVMSWDVMSESNFIPTTETSKPILFTQFSGTQSTPRPLGRPTHEALAQARGHCGTCKHFTLYPPGVDRFMGECALGWAAHEPYRSASREPVVMNEAAQCMTVNRELEPSPRWALRPGAKVAEVN